MIGPAAFQVSTFFDHPSAQATRRPAESESRVGDCLETPITTAATMAKIRSGRRDVVTQRLGFVLHRRQPVFHDIAERHDADEPAELADRDVPELAGRHPLHGLADGHRFGASDNAAGHCSIEALIERGRATLGERTHDVALGQHAGDAACGVHHDQGADPTFGEHLSRGCETGGRLDGPRRRRP